MPSDYVIKAGDIPKTPIERWNANIEAIKLYKTLEGENRGATPDEQRVLARYRSGSASVLERLTPAPRDSTA